MAITDLLPFFFISVSGKLSSLRVISITLGEQKPDWHLPIPALVLSFYTVKGGGA